MAILFDWYELPEPKDKQREEKILHPRIRLNGSTTTDELRRRIQERSSLTETDVSARSSPMTCDKASSTAETSVSVNELRS